jgi:predicted metal-dependent hydrolase
LWLSETVSYQLKRSSRRRTLALQVGSAGVIVHAPLYLETAQIDAFVQSKSAWLQRQLAQRQPAFPVFQLVDGAVLPCVDERLTLRIVHDKLSAITAENNTLWLQLSARIKADNQQKQIRELVVGWYCAEALRYFSVRLDLFATLMRVNPRELLIKNWQTKWGSCDSTGQICLNWRLLLAPQWVSDYVVIHELAHLRQMNHSPAYWQIVAQYCPNWQQARDYLKQQQQSLDLK